MGTLHYWCSDQDLSVPLVANVMPRNRFAQILSNLHVNDNKLEFTCEDIRCIIKDFNHNKAQGHDYISIRMIKLCGNSITFPLFKIFMTSLKTGVFPDSWKKGNIVPVHKKSSKEIVSNYRPISLLPIYYQ